MAGTADQVVPYQQTVNLIHAAQALIGTQKAQLELVAEARHGIDDFMDPKHFKMKLEFVQKVFATK